MPIPNPTPVPYPPNPAILMDQFVIETFAIANGSGLNAPAHATATLLPAVTLTGPDGATAQVTHPAVPGVTLVVPDVYAWVAARTAAGDPTAGAFMQALIALVTAEYARQTA